MANDEAPIDVAVGAKRVPWPVGVRCGTAGVRPGRG